MNGHDQNLRLTIKFCQLKFNNDFLQIRYENKIEYHINYVIYAEGWDACEGR